MPRRRSAATRPLVVVANRLPVGKTRGTWKPSAGGLVTALRPVTEEVGGAWVGWDGGVDDVPEHVDGLDISLRPVALTRAQVKGYYHGFSNRTIWPLFHDLLREPVIDRRSWRSYQEVNRAFAEATVGLELGGVRAGAEHVSPLIWVQDYHLMLVPELLRQLLPGSPIGFFLHIPFPPPELIARLPWREDLIRGMLGADVVAFHTERFRRNFVRSVLRLFPDTVVRGKRLVLADGRRVRTAAHPISIDVDAFRTLATSDDAERELAQLQQQFAGRRVLLGVDRLDYTKGIRHRLQALEGLFHRRPDLRREIAFVQVAVPSRDDVSEYRTMRAEIEGMVGRINGEYTVPGGDVPVHYLYRGVTPARLAAYYRLADVMCVTPLKDGMNLVAKEFVTCQAAGGQDGVLLLSEFAGAALELTEAISCNPFDIEGMGLRIEEALELEPADRRRRLEAMATTVRKRDVYRWVDDALGAIEKPTRTPR